MAAAMPYTMYVVYNAKMYWRSLLERFRHCFGYASIFSFCCWLTDVALLCWGTTYSTLMRCHFLYHHIVSCTLSHQMRRSRNTRLEMIRFIQMHKRNTNSIFESLVYRPSVCTSGNRDEGNLAQGNNEYCKTIRIITVWEIGKKRRKKTHTHTLSRLVQKTIRQIRSRQQQFEKKKKKTPRSR